MRYESEWVSLSPSELQIILRMISAGGNVVRHAQLEHAAWGLHDEVTPNALDVALHRLRKKLFAIDADVKIVNVRGIGYQLQNTSADSP